VQRTALALASRPMHPAGLAEFAPEPPPLVGNKDPDPMKLKKLARRAWVRMFGWHAPWVPSWTFSQLYDFPNPPVKPCHVCKGYSANTRRDPKTHDLVRETSWEYCQSVKTCAATIDWDEVYGHGGS
jgi:hypothetical protein